MLTHVLLPPSPPHLVSVHALFWSHFQNLQAGLLLLADCRSKAGDLDLLRRAMVNVVRKGLDVKERANPRPRVDPPQLSNSRANACRIRLVLSTTAVAYSVLQARRTAVLPLDAVLGFRMLSEADLAFKIRSDPGTTVFHYGATTRVHHIRLRGPRAQTERVLDCLSTSTDRLQLLLGFDRGTSWSPLRLKASFAHWDRVLAAPPTLEGLMAMSRQMHPADLVLAVKAALKRDPSAAKEKNGAGDLPAHVGYWHGLREEVLTPVLEANEAAIEESKTIKFLKGEPRDIVGTIRSRSDDDGSVRHAPDPQVLQAIDAKLFDATPLPSLVAAMISYRYWDCCWY